MGQLKSEVSLVFACYLARIKILTLLIPVFLLGTTSDVTAGTSKKNRNVLRSGEEKYLYKGLHSNKVSPLVRGVKKNMEDRGITAKSARAFGVSAMSNPLVKVDKDGNIHTYIRVLGSGSAERSRLES
jgi:hypothetical protein